MTLSRRKLITGLGATFLAAPAIVRASSLMAISPVPAPGPEIVARYQIVNVGLWRHHIGTIFKYETILVEAAERLSIGNLVTIEDGRAHLVRPNDFPLFSSNPTGMVVPPKSRMIAS